MSEKHYNVKYDLMDNCCIYACDKKKFGMFIKLEKEQVKRVCSELNKQYEKIQSLEKENHNLKEALLGAETEYIHERYYNNPLRIEESLKDLKEDFKRSYWNE